MKKAFLIFSFFITFAAAISFSPLVSKAQAADNSCIFSVEKDPVRPNGLILFADVYFKDQAEMKRINKAVKPPFQVTANGVEKNIGFGPCGTDTPLVCAFKKEITIASPFDISQTDTAQTITFNLSLDEGKINCSGEYSLPALGADPDDGALPPPIPDDEGAGGGGAGAGAGGAGGEGNAGNGGAFDGGFTAVTDDLLDSFNPLKVTNSEFADDFSTPGGILSRFLNVFAFPLAGLILFVMIIWGGFEMVAGATNKKSLDAGRQRITAALIGFILLFASYWIARVLEVALGVNIL